MGKWRGGGGGGGKGGANEAVWFVVMMIVSATLQYSAGYHAAQHLKETVVTCCFTEREIVMLKMP